MSKVEACPCCGGKYEEGSAKCPWCGTINKERERYLKELDLRRNKAEHEQVRKDIISETLAKICFYGFVITTVAGIALQVLMILVKGLVDMFGG